MQTILYLIRLTMELISNNLTQINQFVHQIRTFSDSDEEQFNEQLKELLIQKSVDENFKKECTEFYYFTLNNAFFVNAFADSGIQLSHGFFSEIAKRFKHKILPDNISENEFSHFIMFIFSKRSDYEWVGKINYSSWELICKLIDTSQFSMHSEKLGQQIHNAIIILCHRLTCIGIDSYLVQKFPEIDDHTSPFFALNQHVSLFVKRHLKNLSDIDSVELENVWQSINRTEQLFIDLEAKKDEKGTSLHLIFLTQRARKHISRIKLLLNLFITKRHSNRVLTVSQLICELVKAEHTKNNISNFIKENTNLLAYRIVSHTSEKGEHYIGFSKKENLQLFKSAMGGGLVVVLLVYIKHLIHELHLSLFFEGLLFGLNYGLGFVFMHLVHFTLATKQPAMTASYIAQSIGHFGSTNKNPWVMFKQIIRSQFISLIGNLVIVLPLCFLSAWLMNFYFHYSIFNYTESHHYMYSNHPWYSGSLIYACFAGVFLSLSGIVIGYYDNKVVYSEIAERIIKHPKFIKKYSLQKRKKMAAFIEKNLGAIIGNLFLGFCLGMAGNIGKFIGIPFDIRHITISAGNFGIALGCDHAYKVELIITIFIGIVVIGLVNIASSFLISFALACRSRGLSLRQSLKILIGISK